MGKPDLIMFIRFQEENQRRVISNFSNFLMMTISRDALFLSLFFQRRMFSINYTIIDFDKHAALCFLRESSLHEMFSTNDHRAPRMVHPASAKVAKFRSFFL